ncbi:Pseudaminic acid synthase [Azospirillaceae bacterium]
MPLIYSDVVISGRRIGPECPPYIVAELSGNHGGDIQRALNLIDAAKAAGADAVKIQTYTADTLTLDCNGPGFRLEGGLWAGRTLYDLYQEAHTPWEWHARLFQHARSLGLTIFSSPFDETAVELLESLDAPAYKIASFELVDLGLIARVAQTGRPLILSTGMATLGEINDALTAARAAGAKNIMLLHCTSGYPTPPEDCDLRTIPHLAEAFGVTVGLSDHTMGSAVAVAAVTLGAAMVEKHFTFRRAEGGVDSAFSMEPDEFRSMADACRVAHAALGKVDYSLKPSEAGGRDFRRSLYIVSDMNAGDLFSSSNVRSIRPGFGLPPKYLPHILGRRAVRALRRGEALEWSMVV